MRASLDSLCMFDVLCKYAETCMTGEENDAYYRGRNQLSYAGCSSGIATLRRWRNSKKWTRSAACMPLSHTCVPWCMRIRIQVLACLELRTLIRGVMGGFFLVDDG